MRFIIIFSLIINFMAIAIEGPCPQSHTTVDQKVKSSPGGPNVPPLSTALPGVYECRKENF
jgi:hypothetical protein